MAEVNQTKLAIATIQLLINSNAQIAHQESSGITDEYIIGDRKTVRYSVVFNHSTKKYEILMGLGTQESHVVCSETDNTKTGQEIKKTFNAVAAAFDMQMTRSFSPGKDHSYNL